MSSSRQDWVIFADKSDAGGGGGAICVERYVGDSYQMSPKRDMFGSDMKVYSSEVDVELLLESRKPVAGFFVSRSL